MEECLRRAEALVPENRFITAFGWGGCRAMAALARADLPAAIDAFARGAVIMRTLPQAEPAVPRDMAARAHRGRRWQGGRQARQHLAYQRDRAPLEPRRARLRLRSASRPPRRRRQGRGARRRRGPRCWRGHARPPVPAPRIGPGAGRRLGEPARWLADASADFTAKNFTRLAAWCQDLLAKPSTSRLDALGITPREAEVLGLIAAGLANKDIAARLYLSPRTVEKHVESLLRKTGATSRTMLVAITGPWRTQAPHEPASPVT